MNKSCNWKCILVECLATARREHCIIRFSNIFYPAGPLWVYLPEWHASYRRNAKDFWEQAFVPLHTQASCSDTWRRTFLELAEVKACCFESHEKSGFGFVRAVK